MNASTYPGVYLLMIRVELMSDSVVPDDSVNIAVLSNLITFPKFVNPFV